MFLQVAGKAGTSAMLNDYFDVHLQFVLQAAPRGRRALSPGSKSPRSPTPPRPGSNKLSIPVSVFKPRGLLCTNLQLCFRLHVKLCMWVEMENVMNANEHVQKREETIKKRMTPPIGQGIAVVRRSRSPRRRAHTLMTIWYYACGCRCWRLACVGCLFCESICCIDELREHILTNFGKNGRRWQKGSGRAGKSNPKLLIILLLPDLFDSTCRLWRLHRNPVQVVLNHMALHSQRAQTLRALIMKSNTNAGSSSTNLPVVGSSEEPGLGTPTCT